MKDRSPHAQFGFFANAARTLAPVLPPASTQRHNPSGRGLAVRESLLPGAGLGLFATEAWAAGSILCEYRGKARAQKRTSQTVCSVPRRRSALTRPFLVPAARS